MKTVLVAPLNWGLGHATRCMPIIDELQKQGATVLLASDGAAYQLLQKEYPHLPLFELPTYNIRYPFTNMVASMTLQMPKILRGCIQEYFWLKKFLTHTKIDTVISDNRFGLYHKSVQSIFLSHQVNIQAPFSTLINALNHYFIEQFDECWVPDYAHRNHNLSGTLAHGKTPQNIKIRYIGLLSRFQKLEIPKKYKIAFILSGPEPQRTYFEEKIIHQLQNLEKQNMNIPPQYVLVRGIVKEGKNKILLKNTIIYNYLTNKELNKIMCESEYIISRSGYSTIMDLAKIEAQAILIPTTGQTEQEYLAQKLSKEKLFFSQKQSYFNIKEALQQSPYYTGFRNFYNKTEQLPEIIGELLKF